jgi:hypothetical protein
MALQIAESTEILKLNNDILIPAKRSVVQERTTYTIKEAPFAAANDIMMIGVVNANWELWSVELTSSLALTHVNDWNLHFYIYKMGKIAHPGGVAPKQLVDYGNFVTTGDIAANTAWAFNIIHPLNHMTIQESLYQKVNDYNESDKIGYQLSPGITEDDATDSEFLLGAKITGTLPIIVWGDNDYFVFDLIHSSNRELNSETIYACHRQEGYR